MGELLFERMALGLTVFRPFFMLQERKPGEFDSLRVCRELIDADEKNSGGQRRFDVELVRMGNAALATPENFAEMVFPPMGRPPDVVAAKWQREIFYRIFQKDASKYVNTA